jgi:tetratricopeptide (TPR) repeat protein
VAKEQQGQMRFGMLETFREYGWEQMAQEERQAAQQRHARWFLERAEEADLEHLSEGAARTAVLDRLKGEHDNLHTALDWYLGEEGDVAAAARMDRALNAFWDGRGYWKEGRRWTEAVLQRSSDLPSDLYAWSMRAAGVWAFLSGDYPLARSWYEQALALFRQTGDREGTAMTLLNMGDLTMLHQADYERARTLHREGLTIARELSHRRYIEMSLGSLTWMADLQGNAQEQQWIAEQRQKLAPLLGEPAVEEATLSEEEAIAQARESGNRQVLATCLYQSGKSAHLRGEYARSHTLYEEALAINRELGNKRWVAHLLNALGYLFLEAGELECAAPLFEQSLVLMRELGDRRLISYPLRNLGILAFYQGDFERARRVLEECLALCRELQFQSGITEALCYLGRLALKQGNYQKADDRLREALLTTRRVQVKRWVVVILEAYAALLVEVQQMQKASCLLGSASALRESLGCIIPAVDRAFVEQATSAARIGLGEAAFAVAWCAGRSLSCEEAVAYALDQTSRVPVAA